MRSRTSWGLSEALGAREIAVAFLSLIVVPNLCAHVPLQVLHEVPDLLCCAQIAIDQSTQHSLQMHAHGDCDSRRRVVVECRDEFVDLVKALLDSAFSRCWVLK